MTKDELVDQLLKDLDELQAKGCWGGCAEDAWESAVLEFREKVLQLAGREPQE